MQRYCRSKQLLISILSLYLAIIHVRWRQRPIFFSASIRPTWPHTLSVLIVRLNAMPDKANVHFFVLSQSSACAFDLHAQNMATSGQWPGQNLNSRGRPLKVNIEKLTRENWRFLNLASKVTVKGRGHFLMHTQSGENVSLLDILFQFLTLFLPGGGRFAPTITYLRIHVCVCVYTWQFFVTFPHFECGRGYNRFYLKKIHRFLRN